MWKVVCFCVFTGSFASSDSNLFEVGFMIPESCPSNYALQVDSMYAKSEVPETLCARNCKRDPGCLSYNYGSGICEFNTGKVDSVGSNLVERTGFGYYEKVGFGMESTGCSEMTSLLPATSCYALTSVASSETVFANRGGTQGDWGKDSLAQDGKIYFVAGHSNARSMIEYPSESDFQNDANGATRSLPVGCDGCNNLFYGGKFYCNEVSTKNVVVIDLVSLNVEARISLDNVEGNTAGNHNQCHYGWGGYSDIDIEADEKGLWVVYGRQNDGCNIGISKIDPSTNTIEQTWWVPVSKSGKGNVFMKCGILYVIKTYNGNPTYISHTYDTTTSTFTEYTSAAGIPWYNHHGYLSHAHYDKNEGVVYVWDRGYQSKVTLT